jgi:hypothetical protein
MILPRVLAKNCRFLFVGANSSLLDGSSVLERLALSINRKKVNTLIKIKEESGVLQEIGEEQLSGEHQENFTCQVQ